MSESPLPARLPACFPGIWGICLAGGLSSRMGQDKAMLPHQSGGTFLDHAFHLLRSLLDPVYVSCSKRRPYKKYNLLYDAAEGCGPLGGIYSALKKARDGNARAIMCLACDLPLMTTKPLSRLLNIHLRGNFLATVFLNPFSGKKEMTAAVYSCAALPWVENSLLTNKCRLAAMLPENLVELVTPLPEEMPAFLNCNTPEDYREIFLR